MPIRNLVLVLGDQLNSDSAAFDGFESGTDAVWMAEVFEESTKVWSHKARIALFLSAMRHFRDLLQKRGIPVHYMPLDKAGRQSSFSAALEASVKQLRPLRLIAVKPGEWQVQEDLRKTALKLGVGLEIRPDRHFICSAEKFAAHADSRKQLRMEYFYRAMRRDCKVLMNEKEPAGGQWNFDKENRAAFGRDGPGKIAEPIRFSPDATTREVIKLVQGRFADHPGSLDNFDWPVTDASVHQALADFINTRLPHFGEFQDAMWAGRPWLYHSRLSSAMNLKLLSPREVIRAAEKAHRDGRAPIASVEGFVRQVLGWREYVRGVYWRLMPDYAKMNALGASLPLPSFYWTAETEMNCLRDAIKQTLEYGYAHHIQRLMVTGLFALLLGVKPKEVYQWYLAIYVDAVEWVELPNTLGMSQFADGGIMASKPYVATGKYIQRMSNYCEQCRYDPAKSTGNGSCPFTTLYWDFLMRHQRMLKTNPRMKLQVRNMERIKDQKKREIRKQAEMLKTSLSG